MDAAEAGLWLFWVLEREVIAVPRPAILIENDRLHSGSGPAVSWPNGARYWFWRGIQVPQQVIEAPETLQAKRILEERNVEIRRVMIERLGADRFLLDAGAQRIKSDAYGALWQVELPGDEPLVMVQVRNATAEPTGEFKDYFLRVPPTVRTPRAAVAWTFGLEPMQYQPAVET